MAYKALRRLKGKSKEISKPLTNLLKISVGLEMFLRRKKNKSFCILLLFRNKSRKLYPKQLKMCISEKALAYKEENTGKAYYYTRRESHAKFQQFLENVTAITCKGIQKLLSIIIYFLQKILSEFLETKNKILPKPLNSL